MTETRKVFHGDLAELAAAVCELSEMALEAIRAGTASLLDGDLSLTRQVSYQNRCLGSRARDIEYRVTLLSVCQQPMAVDQRLLETSARVANELGEIGRLMLNVADTAFYTSPSQLHPTTSRVVERMREHATAQLQLATHAFSRRDRFGAKTVSLARNEITQLQEELTRTVVATSAPDKLAIECAMRLARVGRSFECICDRAANIADQAMYLITGKLPELQSSPELSDQIWSSKLEGGTTSRAG